MTRKWLLAAGIWAAFLGFLTLGLRANSRWPDLTLILAVWALLAAHGIVVLARCLHRRTTSEFWFRNFPRWWVRFVADEPPETPARRPAGARLDPM